MSYCNIARFGAALAVALAASSAPAQTSKCPQNAGSGVAYKLSLPSSPEFHVGGPVAVMLTIENISDGEVWFAEDSGGPEYFLQVLNERGKEVPETEFGKEFRKRADRSSCVSLQHRGDARTSYCEISRMFRMDAAGEYTVVVGERNATGSPAPISNKVILTVLP